MKKVFMAVAALVFAAYSQNDNYNGWGDTAKFVNFYNDTTVYSGWFKLSAFQTVRHTVYMDDTSAAGFSGDSCSGEWGIQTGHPSFLTTSSTVKKMELGRKMVIDTFNTTTGGIFTMDSLGMTTIDKNGVPEFVKGRIDTLLDSLGKAIRSPYAYQSRGPFNEHDVFYRYWIHGIAGNIKSKNIKGYFQAARFIVLR